VDSQAFADSLITYPSTERVVRGPHAARYYSSRSLTSPSDNTDIP